VTVDKLEGLHRLNSPASSSPATEGQRVYVYFGSYGMLAYDLDGNELWKKTLSPTPSRFGSGTSPIVAGDRVLLNCGSQGNFALLALDPASGETLWKKERPQGFATGQWSTPVVRQTADGTAEVFVAGGMRSSAYSLEDGTERWAISGLPAISLNTAAVGDGLIFFSLTNPFGEPDNILQLPDFGEALAKYDSNADGKIAASEVPADLMLFLRGRADKVGDWSPLREAVAGHDRDKDGSLNKEEWQALARQQSDMAAGVEVMALAVRPGGAVNQGTGEIAWKQTTAVPEVPSLLYYDHRIYLVSEKGILTCRDATSGKELYKQRLGVEGTCYASPIVGDDKIYVASDGGTILVFKPGDQYQLCAKNAFDEGILATPALVDGTIYVRTRGHLYACAAPADAR
jgi:outer membrane protein assembly factor BamB